MINTILGKPLSDREQEVFDRAKLGFTNLEISETLGIERNTVTVHMTQVYKKYGVAGRAELFKSLGCHETGQDEGHFSQGLCGG